MWMSLVGKIIIIMAYLYVIKVLFKVEIKRFYVKAIKTKHTGLTFRLLKLRMSLYYVVGEKGYKFISSDKGFSSYRKNGRIGFGYSYFHLSILFSVRKAE